MISVLCIFGLFELVDFVERGTRDYQLPKTNNMAQVADCSDEEGKLYEFLCDSFLR